MTFCVGTNMQPWIHNWRCTFNIIHALGIRCLIPICITHFHTILQKKLFGNIVGKGENAGNQHFLLFPQSFQAIPERIYFFFSKLHLSSANALNLDQSKILLFSEGIIVRCLHDTSIHINMCVG